VTAIRRGSHSGAKSTISSRRTAERRATLTSLSAPAMTAVAALAVGDGERVAERALGRLFGRRAPASIRACWRCASA
jgi:hypothetical protein